MDAVVHMVLKGRLAEMMVMAAPEIYRTYVSYYRKHRPVLYVRLMKALYGFMKSALLFYQKLSGDMKSAGFKINPYDPCVVNKMVGGDQPTVTWHVDNLKVSHRNPQVVGKFVE